MRALILACLLLVPLPAQAALSVTEKAEIAELSSALQSTAETWRHLSVAVRWRTSASESALTSVWSNLTTVQTHLWKAYALILYANPAPPGNASVYAAYEALPRADWVTESFARLDDAQTAITATISAIDAAELIGSQNAAYYTALAEAQTSITQATNSITGFNRSLTYLGPRETPWFPRIVGKHGDWIIATRLLVAAGVRLNEALTDFRLTFNPTSLGDSAMPDSTNHAFEVILQRAEVLFNKFNFVLRDWTDIPTPNYCKMSPHQFMGRVVELLMSEASESGSFTTVNKGGEHPGAPYIFHLAATFLTDFLDLLRPAILTRPAAWAKMNSGLAHYMGSWQAQDGAVWEIMSFPAGVTLAQLRDQRLAGDTGNVAPLCPDAVAPAVTVRSPANGATVGGRLTVVADCTDDGAAKLSCLKVEIKVDDVVKATIVTTPFEYRWDTTVGVSNGSHTLKAVGYDANGNNTTSSTVTVTVAN